MILSLITTLLPTAIHLVEKLITGNKQGETKKDLALSLIGRSLDWSVNAGKVDEEIAKGFRLILGELIDAKVAEINAMGGFESSIVPTTHTFTNPLSVTVRSK